jgi:hypothetical protein
MKKNRNDLSMELYIIDYLGAFLLMLGGFVYLFVSHVEEIIAPTLFAKFLHLIL